MKFRREHKADSRAVQTDLRDFRFARNFDTEFCQNVRAAGVAHDGAITVFGDGQTRAGGDKRGGGRDVKGFRNARTCSRNVYKIFVARFDFNGLLAHHTRHSREFGGGFAFCRQRRQTTGNLRRIREIGRAHV